MSSWPTEEQLAEFLAAPQDEPIVMMNLLRYKPTADGADGMTGEEAMMRYARPMREFVESRGGEFVFAGNVASQLIGEGGEGFDFVSIMRYPSRRTFLELAGDPEIANTIGKQRDAGLDSQWLLVMTEASE
ncbi:MAG TPA: DUF1330 domain-containing protein [Mycobacteriales bacterium]|nr:DUF1330 domain-containing protein [Mycobacteriales bacterium]